MQAIYNILSKENFTEMFKKYKSDVNIIERIFVNGFDFEPNFLFYFPKMEMMALMPFPIFPDKVDEENKEPVRLNFIEKVRNSEVGQKYRYFGHSGNGKSTSLICALKYKLKDNQGGLYINLKCMRKLSEAKNLNKIKQIFIDEIPFLFHDNYENYSEVANAIKDYEFKSTSSSPVWELIEFILEKIKNMKAEKFIIVFDEYKKKNDPISIFDQLCAKYLEGSKIFSFVRVSPQNDNPDIREAFINMLINKKGDVKGSILNIRLNMFFDK